MYFEWLMFMANNENIRNRMIWLSFAVFAVSMFDALYNRMSFAQTGYV